MAADLIGGLRKHKELLANFKKDPIAAIKELEKRLNVSLAKVNMTDIEVIRNLSEEELELLAAISERVKALGGKPFKLGEPPRS